jgi:glycosyltransferase domain-containing protein
LSEPSPLTIVIPTRNRPNQCATLVRFLRRQRVAHRIVIVDSSEEVHAQALRAACGTTAQIVAFPPDTDFFDKLADVIAAIETPFVALMPDDDITFPHAIDRCLDHMRRHPDAAAAQGYAVDFAMQPRMFEILRVRWFTPSIGDDDPLRRLYHLIRRYQPVFWAVFRRDVLLAALQQSPAPGLAFFQEMTFVATVVLLGPVMRVPCIYTLRDIGPSQTPLEQTHPFFAFLADSDGFLAHYHAYREHLVAFIERDAATPSCPPGQLRHMLNLIHAIYFRPELHGGMMEHTVRALLDPSFPPMTMPFVAPAERAVRWRDLTIKSSKTGRRYVWRRKFLSAEPREEITITAEERERVARALDDYQFSPG